MGDGYFQQIPQKKKNHTLPWPQAVRKMGHLNTKTLNRLQAALLEHEYVIQYKKGAIMPADYLSRLPSSNWCSVTSLKCF
jgi:alkylated DNA nucleotide flippase Atl1